MKKQNLLKLALVSIAMMVFTGTQAQVANGDYEEATAAASAITMQTAGTTIGLYAEPDATYNPDYLTPAWTLNPNSVWTWTLGTLTTTANSGTPANYVELNGAAAGNYAINVVESNTSLPGTCVDAGIDHTIVFLPAPTMAVDAAGANAFGTNCGDLLAHSVSFDITAATLANDFLSIQWRLTEYEVTIDGATGNPVVGAPVAASTVHLWDKYLASPQTIQGQSWAVADDAAFNADGVGAPALSGLTLSMTRDYTNTGGEIAYLYRWEISTADGDGVSDRISRKSEYIDGGTGIYGTDGTIDIYIVNAPTTGPIYHIPNSYGN